jgi:predicted HAD superfamily Cof-like phosphohydrolase
MGRRSEQAATLEIEGVDFLRAQDHLEGEFEQANLPGIVDALDALADIAYVTHGAAIEWGLPLDAAIVEVHRSNMTKRHADGRVDIRHDGKILKPSTYEPPDLADVIERARRGVQP